MFQQMLELQLHINRSELESNPETSCNEATVHIKYRLISQVNLRADPGFHICVLSDSENLRVKNFFPVSLYWLR